MKKSFLTISLLVSCLVLESCTKINDQELSPIETSSVPAARVGAENYSPQEIDAFMAAEAAKNNGEFSWKTAPDEIIAAALKHSENILSVGYKIDSYSDKELNKINLKEKAWLEARQRIISIVFEEEKKYHKELQKPEDVILSPGAFLPNFDLKISQLSTIQKLRETGLIRYFEPSAYLPKDAVSNDGEGQAKRANQPITFGCGTNDNPARNLLLHTDYNSLGGTPYSWNLAIPGVQEAWLRGYAGQGLTMAYFDTGCSYLQEFMHNNFAQGMSTGRSIEKISTLYRYDFNGLTTPHDDCGHGTATTSIGTAPRSGGTVVGIAYRSSLVSVKTAYDPVLNTVQEYRGVADAYASMANRSDVKIISMSLGTTIVPGLGGALFVIASETIRDAVRLASQNGKLMFCAAGTETNTPSWMHNMVVFPASMSEVYAVTGVKEKYRSNGSIAFTYDYTTATPCDECFYGSKVDFAVIMQKNYGNARRVLAHTRTANYLPSANFGGSSAATATMASMAAVVWSKFPTYTRQQLIAHLKNYASNPINRNSDFGWGVVNIYDATR